MAQYQVWLGQKPWKSNTRSKKKSDEELTGTENAGRQEQKEDWGGGGRKNFFCNVLIRPLGVPDSIAP